MRWRFTDKALFFEPWESIMTLKAGSLEEYSLLERWGDAGKAPASLLLESCVHAARWLVEASSAFTLSCELRAVDFWQCMDGLRPGERYCVFLRVIERSEESASFALRQALVMPGESMPGLEFRSGEGREDGRLSVRLTPLEERYLPADRASLWRELQP